MTTPSKLRREANSKPWPDAKPMVTRYVLDEASRPPEWPSEFVAAEDYEALRLRALAAERALRQHTQERQNEKKASTLFYSKHCACPDCVSAVPSHTH